MDRAIDRASGRAKRPNNRADHRSNQTIARAAEVRLTRCPVHWIGFFKTSLSTILMIFKNCANEVVFHGRRVPQSEVRDLFEICTASRALQKNSDSFLQRNGPPQDHAKIANRYVFKHIDIRTLKIYLTTNQIRKWIPQK